MKITIPAISSRSSRDSTATKIILAAQRLVIQPADDLQTKGARQEHRARHDETAPGAGGQRQNEACVQNRDHEHDHRIGQHPHGVTIAYVFSPFSLNNERVEEQQS